MKRAEKRSFVGFGKVAPTDAARPILSSSRAFRPNQPVKTSNVVAN